jgi:hypothetical protein
VTVGRPSLEDEVKKAAQDYIAEALTRSPIEAPLSTAAVAKAIGRDRRVLKKYGLDIEIDEAAKLRKRTSRCKVEVKRRTLEVNALVAHQSLLEANMKRFDLDPEELFRPIVPPNRSVSGAIRSRRSGRA